MLQEGTCLGEPWGAYPSQTSLSTPTVRNNLIRQPMTQQEIHTLVGLLYATTLKQVHSWGPVSADSITYTMPTAKILLRRAPRMPDHFTLTIFDAQGDARSQGSILPTSLAALQVETLFIISNDKTPTGLPDNQAFLTSVLNRLP